MNRQVKAGWSRHFDEPVALPDGGGPTMFARIGIMRALNRHRERVFNPDRKDHHWGKRKLKRPMRNPVERTMRI